MHPVDCSVLLSRQLVEISALAGELGRCERAAASGLYREVCNRATLHVLARERVLLPAWRRAGWKELPSDALAAHMNFKRSLAELMVHPPGKPGFRLALEAFVAAVEQHRQQDEQRLMPALRNAMDLDERRALCNDIEVLFDAGMGASNEPAIGSRSVAQALIEEAEVVLSSLPVSSASTAAAAR